MLRNQQSPKARNRQSANLQRRYGYLEKAWLSRKAFDGDACDCLVF
jgi:hypothetical protein